MKRCWPKAALTLCCATMLLSCGQEKGVSVYNTPPSVSIVSPPDGVEEDEGVTIIFEARVGDDIDSDTELDLVWQSDIDNVLTEAANGDGLGNVQFSTANLSIANHIITLIATDSYGESGSDSIEVTIIDVPDVKDTSQNFIVQSVGLLF